MSAKSGDHHGRFRSTVGAGYAISGSISPASAIPSRMAHSSSCRRSISIVRRLLAPIGGDQRGLRDRAVILVGFAGALRGEELASIPVEHLEPTDRVLSALAPVDGSGGR